MNKDDIYKKKYLNLLKKYNQIKLDYDLCKTLYGNFSDDFCPEHKPRGKTMDYISHSEWIDRQEKRGHKKYKCSECGRWLYKCEL